MTESTAVGTRGFNCKKLRKYSSVGLLAPNMQARVVDWSSGSFLPPGNRGELWIQGPGVMKGTAFVLAKIAKSIYRTLVSRVYIIEKLLHLH